MRNVAIKMDFTRDLGPLEINRVSLGQGGQSPDPMWESRVPEIKALRPSLLRFFAQGSFNPMPAPGTFNFDEIIRQIAIIRQTGATPLVTLNFKPHAIFPEVNEKIIHPQNWALWENLIAGFVAALAGRGMTGLFYEVINEPDCGEGGGCPYLATPENYPVFYARTVAAILRADSTARVGGPALSSAKGPILPAFLDYCDANRAPLHFVSWHIYTCNPLDLRAAIDHVKAELARHSALKPLTILDEWSILWDNAADKPDSFLPCFIPEAAWHMMDVGLDYPCYFQIRDYHVDINHFSPLFTETGANFMARWWNRMPQWGGLFDYQNTMRPAYFSFKLLSRLTGNRLKLTADDPSVHGFLTHDPAFRLHNLMFWNFSAEPAAVTLRMHGLPKEAKAVPFALDVQHHSNDENHRIKQGTGRVLAAGDHEIRVDCEPYAVHFWYLMGSNWYLGG